jgi:hypothetical protein
VFEGGREGGAAGQSSVGEVRAREEGRGRKEKRKEHLIRRYVAQRARVDLTSGLCKFDSTPRVGEHDIIAPSFRGAIPRRDVSAIPPHLTLSPRSQFS